MASYYNPSKRLSEWAAALLSPYIKLEHEGGGGGGDDDGDEAALRRRHQTPSSLSVGLWSGNVELSNVELRTEAFDAFFNDASVASAASDAEGGNRAHVRWKLLHGSIDSVRVRIPWKGLLVGTACSSSSPVPDEGAVGEGDRKEKKEEASADDKTQRAEDDDYDDNDDDEERSALPLRAGCTTVQIQGIKMVLGYEVVYRDPFLNLLQSQSNMQNRKGESQSPTLDGGGASSPEEEDRRLRERMREEKNRILQIAERRLLAGLDPFPPSAMEGLQSIVSSTIRDGIRFPMAAMGKSKSLKSMGSDDSPSETAATNTTISSYLSRMESYLSSRIKSLLWRVFDSLSISVSQARVSVVGQSHYDKDFAAFLRRERWRRRREKKKAGGRKVDDGKIEHQQEQQHQHQHQQQQMRLKPNTRDRGGHCRIHSQPIFDRHGVPTFPEGVVNVEEARQPPRRYRRAGSALSGNEAHPPRRRHRRDMSSSSAFYHSRTTSGFSSRQKTRSTIGGTSDEEDSIDLDDCTEGRRIEEDPSIWAREGQVELGLVLDRLDVRPGSKPESHDGKDGVVVQPPSGSSSTSKVLRVKGAGVFLRRKNSTSSTRGYGLSWEHLLGANAEGLHTGKSLFCNDVHTDDYVVGPINVDANCRVYQNDISASSRKVTGSADFMSSSHKDGGESSADGHSKTSSTGATSMETARRRGKRDKRDKQRRATSASPNSLPPTWPASPSSPLSFEVMSAPSVNRPKQGVVVPSVATGGGGSAKRAHFSSNELSSSLHHRLELSLKLGHVRSSVSPRQIFLLHSFSSSMTRLKRGRPNTTIRAAKVYDETLRERMADEGLTTMMVAWEEDPVYQELPEELRSLYSRRYRSRRSLPRVVASWWKYAYFNVVSERHQRKALMDQCLGGGRKRGNVVVRTKDPSCRKSLATRNDVRKEYVDLYLRLSRGASSSPEGQLFPSTSIMDGQKSGVEAASKLRLEQLEDELSVERILLLRHVARAVSVRHTKKADEYVLLGPKPAQLGVGGTFQRTVSSFSPRVTIDGRDVLHPPTSTALSTAAVPLSSVAASRMLDGTRTNRTSILTSISEENAIPKGDVMGMSFSADISLSGISMAVCEFCDDDPANVVDQDYEYPPDDISALTGLSDEDPTRMPSASGVDAAFDPRCRFWPTVRHGARCEPILLAHIADVSASAQGTAPAHVEGRLSVGGISFRRSVEEERLVCLGHVAGGGESPLAEATTAMMGSLLEVPVQTSATVRTTGVSGRFSSASNSSILSVGPSELVVDWAWLERMGRFLSMSEDLKPVPFAKEDLLVKVFSSPRGGEGSPPSANSGANSGVLVEFDKLSLTVPVHPSSDDGGGDDEEELFLVTTANRLRVATKGSDLYCGLEMDGAPAVEDDLLPIREKLLVLDDLDTAIVSRKSTRPLLSRPVSIRLQYSSGDDEGTCLLGQTPKHLCRSYDVRSSAVNMLISNVRLRALMDMMETASGTVSGTGDTAAGDDLSGAKASMHPFTRDEVDCLLDYKLEDTSLSIQSLRIQIIPDGDGNDYLEHLARNNSFSREQVEDIIASFISQLSCLDFQHPSENAISCMTRLAADRCHVLGLSTREARKLLEAAKRNFKKEAGAIFRSTTSDAAELSDSRCHHSRTADRSTKTNGDLADLDMNPMSLSVTLDQIVGRATIMTMEEMNFSSLPLSDDSHLLKKELHVDADSLAISRSLFYGRSLVKVNACSLSIRNEQTSLFRIRQPSLGEEKLPGEANDVALTISLRDRDRSIFNRGGGREIHFEAGKIESIFAPESHLEALEICRITGESVLGTECGGTEEDEIDYPESPTKDIVITGNISSFSVVLMDKDLPFLECQLQDVAVEKSTVKHPAATKTSVHANTISLECVCQSAYPDIISSLSSPKNGAHLCSLGHSEFSVIMTAKHNPTSGPDEVFIGLDGVRIVLLRQTLNEILQYASSPNYGVGLFLSRIESEKEAGIGDNASTSDPSKLKFVISDSSLILPRDSQSIDMVCFEMEEVSISCEQVAESWSIDRYTFSDKAVPPPAGGVEPFASSSSSEVFFDCAEDYDQLQSSRGTPTSPLVPLKTTSNTEAPQITRFVVQVRGAHIFTALNRYRFRMDKVHMPEINGNVQHTGRANHNKPPFAVCGKLKKSMAKEVKSRAWERITKDPINLGIKADYAPKLRLLIEDIGDGDSRAISLDMRMSQFYLLMSVWFSNMQELPVMFPYEKEYIKSCSITPDPPLDWPEYGTSEFVKRLKCVGIAKATFEMALCFKNLSLRCSYDGPDYFSKAPQTLPMMQSSGRNFISVAFGNVVCSIIMDEDTLQRIGVGAASFQVLDGGQREKSFAKGVKVKDDHRQTLLDINFGLDCGRHTLIDGLPLPFQATVFMTPDHRCLINLGMDMAEAALTDLTLIWVLLEYFGLYFQEEEYGHPAFEVEQIYHTSMGDNASKSAKECDDESLNIDFRLFMIKPHIVILPPTSKTSDGPCVMLEAAGLHYRYKSFGANYSSQDVVAKDLGIAVLMEYMEPSMSRGLRQVSGSLCSGGVITLVDGLSCSLRYDYNTSTHFTRFSLRVPLTSQHFDRHTMDGIESSNIEAKPISIPPPLVCKPFQLPSRNLGHHETSIYFSEEYMKLALDLLTGFVGPSEQDGSVNNETACDVDSSMDSCENIFSVTASIERVKCVISDPVMGMHRPLFSICLPSVLLTASQLQEIQQGRLSKFDKVAGRDSLNNAKDLQASMEATLYIDYFKLGLTRNWEPFLEPFQCLIMYEKSASRGKGITFNADCPLHLNITNALIETTDDAIKTFNLFRSGSTCIAKPSPPTKRCSLGATSVKTVATDDQGHNFTILHSPAEQLEENERVAFSLKNITGERVRVHAHSALEADMSSSQTTIAYLDHLHLMSLSFPATETIIRNLQPVEVPFKGDQNISSSHHRKQNKIATGHDIDLQVPGFLWVRNVSFDKAGKHFIPLVPRSLSIQAKINEDWRLKNALFLLAEVNSVNGGRRLTIMSTFEVVNKTNHPFFLAINPDPRHPPQNLLNESLVSPRESVGTNSNVFAINRIDPDEVYSISYLLLEASLRLNGNHLGSLWIRPDQASNDNFNDVLGFPSAPGIGQSTIGYPSRPIQLAKILHESSIILKDCNGDSALANQFASGSEVSCPIFDGYKNRTSSPFCYVLEVKRSPFVRSTQAETLKSSQTGASGAGDLLSPARVGKGLKNAKNLFIKNSAHGKDSIHGPMAYSLSIHPPIVVENLLPERGRFELMNATSKIVLWWGILEAGEKVPVHTVGLDAPLLLLVNLGFCRTAVGEGALVHHGGGGGLFKAGWNTIGSAMKTSKDRVKRTLHTMTDSKDNRGAKRAGMIKTGRQADLAANRKGGPQLGFNTENDIIESSGGGVIGRRDGFGAEDIATELVVIDSLGQRLVLHIENVLGCGGQRRISLYSPFWIVNTTEHPLRYKQEKVTSFVAGTVLSPEKDGSKPVDGSYRNDIDEDDGLIFDESIDSLNTVFSGRPGALSLLKTSNDNTAKPSLLAALISEDLPLCVVSKLAFMFNFQDVLSLGGSTRLCIQLADTTNDISRYTSSWSSGFGLESVGVTQIVRMHCKDGRGLEVSVSISIAPGRLSNFTKIVRICPRYIVVNQLPWPIRLWQDNSLVHPNLALEHSSKDANESQKWMFTNREPPNGVINQYEILFGSPTLIDCREENGMMAHTTAHQDACYIATVRPSELVAFHLPDTRLERLLRVDFGPSWYLSPSFHADVTCKHAMKTYRARDLQMLPHVSSRGAPEYTVTLPPANSNWNGELGVWFETGWGTERTLIVKGIREGSYASYFSEIIVGDELIMIDNIPVGRFTFDKAMKYLKTRLSAAKEVAETRSNQPPMRALQRIGNMQSRKRMRKDSFDDTRASLPNANVVTLTFLTLEERLRRLRRAAVSKNATGPSVESMSTSNILASQIDHSTSTEAGSSKDLLIDMKFLFQSIFVFVRAPDLADPPHRIINRSLHWVIYYRQRACDSHPWKSLSPGESASYTWEEPLKDKKLSVRVGVGEWIEGGLGKSSSLPLQAKKIGPRPLFSFQFILNEEQGHFGPTKTVKLEEIGYLDKLSCPGRGDFKHGPSNNGKESSLRCQVDTEGSTRVLIISDEATGTNFNDESLVRLYLASISQEISDEERRRESIDALNKSCSLASNIASSLKDGIKVNVGKDTPSIPLSPVDEVMRNSSHSEPDRHQLCSPEGSLSIEFSLQEIVDYDEGLFITKRNQVLVEVMEATGLRSSDLNGLSNPYVKVGLICGNKKRRTGSFRSKLTRQTYFVEKTLSPQWCSQSFIFDVPASASSDPSETRRFSIQCVIKSKQKLGQDKFLGQAHVHLRNLKDQKESIGWYPLMGKLGQSDAGRDALDRVSGSIRLRVQWVYDYPGLLEYYLMCSDCRLETLVRSREGMKRQLKSLQDAAKRKREQDESFAVAGVPALAAMYKSKKRVNVEPDLESRGTATKGEKSTRPSKVIKGVLSTEKKWKHAINAARFMVAAKHPPKIEVKPRKDLILVEDINAEDDSSSDQMSDSFSAGKLLVEESSSGSHSFSLGGKSSDTAVPQQDDVLYSHNSVSSSKSPLSLTHTSNNARVLCLRWKSWEHHTNNDLALHTPPLYPSWHASCALLNQNTKQLRSPFKSPTDRIEVDGDQEGISLMTMFLKMPPEAPHIAAEREDNHVCELMRSRASFSKAARRSLGSVLNLGGVLTIRPITALNLPENYTGMFIKLRYGNTICLSETVDSKVAPVWIDESSLYSTHTIQDSTNMKRSKRSFVPRRTSSANGGINDFRDIAEMVNPAGSWGLPRENDIRLDILPFETSKSLRLTVIGERLQSKVEIGVLEIPLGPALECCAQSMEDYEEDMYRLTPKGLPPAYVRWFPLMSPSEAVPIEGDMGRSTRPLESEKLNDTFTEYFAPCIKLALMFQPNEIDDVHAGAGSCLGRASGTHTEQYAYARLDRISAALIDSCRITELLSISSRGADVRYSVTKQKTRMAFAVGNVQVDQQSLGMDAKVPVILAPTPVKLPLPTVQFMAWKDNIRSRPEMESFEYVAIHVQEMDLKIEESWLCDVWFFYLDVMKKREARANIWDQVRKTNFSSATFEFEGKNDAIEEAAAFLKEDEMKLSKKIYIKELFLGFMKVNFSYFKSSKSNWGNSDLSEETLAGVDHHDLFPSSSMLPNIQPGEQSGANAYRQWSENMTYGDVDERSHYANIISAVLPSISAAPIRFQERIIPHVYESADDILLSLKTYYSAEALSQIYKMIGSLDFVGNPAMVLSSFCTGLRDFILQPSRELKYITKNPSRVGVGVLKGTLSLFSNSTSGIFGFASNWGSTFGHTAAILTLDEHFQRIHSKQKVEQQRHYDRWKKKGFGRVTLMVTRPVEDIVFGIGLGVTGILTEPYRGAKNDGLIGFTKGTAIGVIGVVVKPIVGLSDAFAHVTESIHDIAKSVNLLEANFNPIERYRLPYAFTTKRMLLPFNQVEARSAQLLLAHPLDKKVRKGDEVIVASEALQMGNVGIDHYVIVTTMRVVLFRLKVVDGHGFVTVSLVWQLRFGKGARIASSLGHRGHTGSVLYVSRYTSQKREDLDEEGGVHHSLHETIDQSGHLFGEEGKYPSPETPKSFYPSGPTTAAFRLRTSWPFAASECDGVTRYAIEGEFQQSSQLSRIHNAICCLSGDFDSILFEGIHNAGSEGVTSFGPLIFERTHQTRGIWVEKDENDLNSLYSSLEQTTWECDGLQHDTPLFSEVRSNSSLSGGPSWLVESRARGMFIPPPPPILPSNVDLTCDTGVPRVLSELETDARTTESVSQVMHGLAKNEHFLLDSIFSADKDNTEIEEEHSISSLFPKSYSPRKFNSNFDDVSAYFENEDSNHTILLQKPSPTTLTDTSAKTMSMEDKILQEKLPKINDAENTSEAIGYERFGLVERLCRVEAMLGHLMGCDSSTATKSLGEKVNDNDHFSAALSFNAFNTATQSHQSHGGSDEIKALRKEIKDLKIQLAAKNDSRASADLNQELHVEAQPVNETTEPEKKYHRVCTKKKIFRRKRAK